MTTRRASLNDPRLPGASILFGAPTAGTTAGSTGGATVTTMGPPPPPQHRVTPIPPAGRTRKFTVILDDTDTLIVRRIERSIEERTGEPPARSRLTRVLYRLLDEDPALFERVLARLTEG